MAQHALELRSHVRRVLLHQLQRMGLVLEVEDVALLVDLVVGDGLDGEQLLHVFLVGFARRHDGDTRAGERDLRRGGKLIDHVGVARLAAEREDVREFDVLALKLVDAVGVVPHEGEVLRGRLQIGDAADRLLGVDDAVGVRIFRHAPHALDRRVLDVLFDEIHVRAGGRHGNDDHLAAE